MNRSHWHRPLGRMLEVEDDGCGFDVEQARGVVFGLRIMRYRARLIGGMFSLSRTRSGTMLCSSIPV